MTSSSGDSHIPANVTARDQTGRVVYVVQDDADRAAQRDQLDLFDLWDVLWPARWTIMGIVTVFVILAVIYALLATEWYRADTLLAPAEERTTQGIAGQLGQLGGLASLAGISVGGAGNAEAIAILESRDLTRSFIQDRDLMPTFFSDLWDQKTGTWLVDTPEERPDIRDAVKFFDETVRTVYEDEQTGLVRLSIDWTDPALAAAWANALVSRVNDVMRRRAIQRASANVAFLRSELTGTEVVPLQRPIGAILESELQKLTLARGNEEFAFRVLDSAQVPKERDWPRRTLIVAVATILGGIFSVMFVLVRHMIHRKRRGRPGD